MPVTREQILKGKSYTEEVRVKGYDESFQIRPLTDGEYAEVRAVALKNTRLKSDGKIDWENTQITDVVKAQAESKFLTVAYGLSVNENWTPEDVKMLRPGTADILETKILEISGVTRKEEDLDKLQEELENFPQALEGEK